MKALCNVAENQRCVVVLHHNRTKMMKRLKSKKIIARIAVVNLAQNPHTWTWSEMDQQSHVNLSVLI